MIDEFLTFAIHCATFYGAVLMIVQVALLGIYHGMKDAGYVFPPDDGKDDDEEDEDDE